MKNKIVQILVVLVLSSIVLFVFYLKLPLKPTSFNASKVRSHEINQLFPQGAAKDIQDIIYIDKTHVFVPFITKENTYGESFWIWKHNKWKLSRVESSGGNIRLWKINPDDPSSYVFVWNMNPADKIEQFKIRLMQKRSSGVTNDKIYYYPKIYLEKNIYLDGKTYGILKYPSAWAELTKMKMASSNENQESMFFDDENESATISTTWTVYKNDGKEIFPMVSLDGDTYSLDNEVIDYIMIDTDKEIEEQFKSEWE